MIGGAGGVTGDSFLSDIDLVDCAEGASSSDAIKIRPYTII